MAMHPTSLSLNSAEPAPLTTWQSWPTLLRGRIIAGCELSVFLPAPGSEQDKYGSKTASVCFDYLLAICLCSDAARQEMSRIGADKPNPNIQYGLSSHNRRFAPPSDLQKNLGEFYGFRSVQKFRTQIPQRSQVGIEQQNGCGNRIRVLDRFLTYATSTAVR